MELKKFRLGPLSTNAYLFYKDGEAILFDAPPSSKEIVNFINENKLKLKGLFLTHGHFDHIKGIGEILKLDPNIKIYISEKEVNFLNSSYRNLSLLWFPYYCSYNLDSLNTVPLKGCEEIEGFSVLETPGHTVGGLTFINKTLGVAISGDNVYTNSIGSFRLPTGNRAQLLESLILLNEEAEKDNLKILPGHGREFFSDRIPIQIEKLKG